MKKKLLHKVITCCAECPYSYYSEYTDVGFSFGFDYYCKNINTQYRPLTEKETNTTIRPECPLQDLK